MYFLFPQHHGNDRFYMTSISMGQFKPTSLYPLVCSTLPKWRPWVYVCEGLLCTGLTGGGWLGCSCTSLGVNELCYWGDRRLDNRAPPEHCRAQAEVVFRTQNGLFRIKTSLMKSRSLESTAIVFCMDHVVKVEVLILHKHPF